MRNKRFFVFITLVFFGCENTDSEPSLVLAETKWRSQFISAWSVRPDYLEFSLDGQSGVFYQALDSCYESKAMEVESGTLLIDGETHDYRLVGSLLRISFPFYDMNNPEVIAGQIEIPYVSSSFSSDTLSICNQN
jgi:hypothetical protein